MAVEWFYFALLSSVLISGVNIIDKILISDYKIPPLVYVLVISATSLMPLVTLAFFHNAVTARNTRVHNSCRLRPHLLHPALFQGTYG